MKQLIKIKIDNLSDTLSLFFLKLKFKKILQENEIENMATKNNVDKTMLNYHEFVNSNKNHNSKRQTIYNERKWHTTNLTYRLFGT